MSVNREAFRSHEENVTLGEELGLTCLYTMMSNKDDWDNYETLQWWAVNEYIRSNLDDPDNKELVERMQKAKRIYLRWGRNTISWGIYIFRNEG